MTRNQILAALEKAGTAQNRKTFTRHGVNDPMFGVSYAELNKLKKRVGTDQDLAAGLWDSGNHDARVLACMIADRDAFTSRQLDAWARELRNYVLGDALSGLVAGTPHARRKIDAWKDRKNEFVAAAGWNVLSMLAGRTDSDLPDQFCEELLDQIAAQIHERPNRVRHSMNQAVISLGVRNPRLQKKALKVAAAMGKIEVDHGPTSCQTPDAAAYIEKTLAHRQKKGRK
jgi:3-methyladenine DNA glycosylase AlkD